MAILKKRRLLLVGAFASILLLCVLNTHVKKVQTEERCAPTQLSRVCSLGLCLRKLVRTSVIMWAKWECSRGSVAVMRAAWAGSDAWLEGGVWF
jgi:hypothetical protein